MAYGDNISRKAAIDELDKGAWGVEWDKALAKSMLENLPSVQPEIPDDARDAFMNLVYDELHSDGDNNRANRIIYAADEYVEYSLAKQSAQPDNQVHLCDSCSYTYPECPSAHTDMIFGNGIGNDNVCACSKYLPPTQPEPCEDAVSKEKILKFFDDWMSALDENCHNQSVSDLKIIKRDFENLPPVTPKQRTGEWVMNDHIGTFKIFTCSECGWNSEAPFNFCPNCGVKMGGDAE